MPIEVVCDCGKVFSVPEEQAGAFVNCPGCGKAVRVEGLRDPFWRALQAGALVISVVVAVVVGRAAGWGVGVLSGAAVACFLWILSRAL